MKFKQESFIGIYKNALSHEECLRVIELFEQNPNKTSGSIYLNQNSGVKREDLKKDIEIPGLYLNDNSEISNIILKGLCESLEKYKKTYHDSLNQVDYWRIESLYNIQKYETKDDGYKAWHTEHGGTNTANRLLSWMIYLNKAKSGTEFFYYKNIKAFEGCCAIWPAGWTHLHRSEPNKGLKYIATGWGSFI